MNPRHGIITALAALSVCVAAAGRDGAQHAAESPTYCVVDTGQRQCFSDKGQLLEAPGRGEPFFGQDAFYEGPRPAYRDNRDGTVSDLNTGMVWQKAFALGRKLTYPEALAEAKK